MAPAPINLGNPVTYYLNRTIVRLYNIESEPDLETTEISKRDVTNAVVIGSIFAMLMFLFLLLILTTCCWFRCYQLLLINNRLVIRAKGYRFLNSSNGDDYDDQEAQLENEKAVTTFDKSHNVISNKNANVSTTAVFNKTPQSNSATDEEKVLLSASANHNYSTDANANANNYHDDDSIEQPLLDSDDEQDLSDARKVSENDSFCRTLLIQNMLAQKLNSNQDLENKHINDVYSDSKIRIGMIVVVIKDLTANDIAEIINGRADSPFFISSLGTSAAAVAAASASASSAAYSSPIYSSSAVRKDPNFGEKQKISSLSTILLESCSPEDQHTQSKLYLRKGDLLRVIDTDADRKIAKGILMSNYLEIDAQGISMQTRKFDIDLGGSTNGNKTHNSENNNLEESGDGSESSLIRTFPFDCVTLESSIIKVIHADD